MPRMDDLIGEFINETSESLATLERALADHARQPMTREGWGEAYKLMHTIKGTCGFVQLPIMEGVAAATEGLLDGLRTGRLGAGDAELARLRAAMAQIRYMMDYLAKHGTEPSLSEVEQEAHVPEPATSTAPQLAQLNETIHHAAPQLTMAAAAAQPIARVPDPVPGGERISYATLATLMLARNQLRHLQRAHGDKRVANTQHLLDGLIKDLREKLLPRTAPAHAYPRAAKALLVESGAMRFALAQEHIREVARIGLEQRHAKLDDGAMISLRGNWMPRVSLAQRLGQAGSEHEAYALVVEIKGERVALCVESIGELEELMLQPLPKLLRSSKIYEAAAVLGDGTPCLLMDTAALLAQPILKIAPPMDLPAIVDAPLEHAAPTPQHHHSLPKDEPEHPPAVTIAPRAYLLFSDGTTTPKAIPLDQVARVEHVIAADIARDEEGLATSVRGEILHLRTLPGSQLPTAGDVHAITLLDAPNTGILAHRMGGIVESDAPVPHKPTTHGVLMLTELNGTLTEVIHAPAYVPKEARYG